MPSQGRPFDKSLRKISESRLYGKTATKLATEASKAFEKRRVETPKASAMVQENMKTRERNKWAELKPGVNWEWEGFAKRPDPKAAQWKHPGMDFNEKTGVWEAKK
jgi:hypothetical protein